MTRRRPRARRLRYDTRILLLALLAGLPGGALALILLWSSDLSTRSQWTLAIFLGIAWLTGAMVLRERVIRPLQTLSNMLGALREGDFSIRARHARGDDSLGLALLEVNTLSDTLRRQRLGAMEATALLRGVMAEIEVAVLAFDEAGKLRLVNRAAERLLGHPAARLLGRESQDLGLEMCLQGDTPRTFDATFPGGAGRWELRRTSFRQGGLPHRMIVLSDLSRALREEELQAWQRLVRVLSHEINNSLTPIQSIAGSLHDLLHKDPLPHDWRDDLLQGLSVVRGRSAALGRFMASYTRLARLPSPRPAPLNVVTWVRRVTSLEHRLPVTVVAGPDIEITADGDQLDQLLINLARNAVDAALETDGEVTLGWQVNGDRLEVWIRDSGPGLANTTNLFVPFFTTKANGSGIGLALSRQIAEAHGGDLTLENRSDGHPGCIARLRLPLDQPQLPDAEFGAFNARVGTLRS
jgi:two-component system, NtrC family, nitrogen regulation sensor histidine kinase NtrY